MIDLDEIMGYAPQMGKKGNKLKEGLKIRILNGRGLTANCEPRVMNLTLAILDYLRKTVHKKPQPAYVDLDCPNVDGKCDNCKVCACQEYYY